MTPRKGTSDQSDFGELSRSEVSRANYYESHLSDVQEKEEETDEIDVKEISNVGDIPDTETVFGEETNSKIEMENDLNNFQILKFTSSCGQISTCSRSNFFKIEMKLREVSDCFKKAVSKEVEPVLKEVEPVLKEVEPVLKEAEPVLKEAVPVLRKEEEERIDSRKIELDDLEEIGEPDSKEPITTSSNLKEFQISETIFPDPKEADVPECVCLAEEDRDLLKDETIIEPKLVPDSQELPGSVNVPKKTKSQIPIPIASRKKLSKVSTDDLSSEKEAIIKESRSNFSKIPLLVKEKPTISSLTISISSEKSKSRLQSTEKLKFLGALTSKKRIAKPERCSEYSRSSQVKKSDHLVKAEAVSKNDNLTFSRPSKRSVASVPKREEKVPKAAKRNFITRPNPQPRCSEIEKAKSHLLNAESPKIRKSICSKTFVKDKAENSLLNVYERNQEKVPQRTYIILTDSEEGIDQCDSNCPCHQFMSEQVSLGLSPESPNHYSLDLKLSSSCCLKSQIQEMESSKFIERKKRPNFRTVSVQTADRKMISKGINIDIKESRETSSKALSLDWRKASTKGLNINLISKDSVISLETNVTKIISVFDITIFEEDLERFQKPSKGVLQMRNICQKANTCQPNCQPTETCHLNCWQTNTRDATNNFSGCCKLEKNKKSHLRSENNSEVSAEICKGIPKRPSDRRHKMSGIGDFWTASNKSRAQNIINAICDPFSNKSIKRIKYLIQTKLCRILLDRDSNDSSKTFVSSQRYYVSASREKRCFSPGQINLSVASESKSSSSSKPFSDHCYRKERMAGGSDKLYKCPIRIGSGWEFGGDEDCFLIRKRGRISKGMDVKKPKENEIIMSKGRNSKTSRCEKYLGFGCSSGSNKLGIQKEDGRDRTKERKSTFPGDVITSSHLGRRHEKALRKRSFKSCSCHESDKENGGRDYRRGSQVTSIGREWSQLLSKEMLRTRGKNRVCSGRGEIDESFCDLEQNVRAKLSQYVDLCKSAKYFLMKGSGDVYGVSSTSIPFSDRGKFRRP